MAELKMPIAYTNSEFIETCKSIAVNGFIKCPHDRHRKEWATSRLFEHLPEDYQLFC